MRIGLIIYGTIDTLSGGYLYDRMLVQSLRVAGHEIVVYSFPLHDYTKLLTDNAMLAWAGELAAAPLDLLLQDELNHPSLFWLNRHIRRKARFPIISIIHHLRTSEEHPPVKMALYRFVERHYLATLDGYLANSNTTVKSVERLLGHPLPCYRAYPAADHLHGSEPAITGVEITARAHEPGPLRLLFVGNLIPRKGLHFLLEALARLETSFWQLTIIGRDDVDIDYTKRIQGQISALDSAAQISWRGRVADHELVNLYRHHHLLAVPSYEGFGIVYLEAMRFGLPILAANFGAAHEIVTPDINGWLVNPAATPTMAALIGEVTADRTRLAAMGAAARRRYEQHPTWEQSMRGAVGWIEALEKTNRRQGGE